MKKLLFTLVGLFLMAPIARSQAVRWDSHALTINSSAPLPGALYPVLAITSATVSICNYSATDACPTLATTYTDATGTTACPTTAQLTASQSAICTPNTDAEGAIGAWLTAGTYQYNITTSYGQFGPFQFSVGAGGGGGGGGCGPLSGDATSTNCGNGNFVSAGTTSKDQAYGYTNMGSLTNPTFSVAIGNNSLITGSGNNSDIVAVGDFAANNIAGSTDLIALGDSPAENVNIDTGICIGLSACSEANGGSITTGSDLIALGNTALGETVGNTAMNNIIAIGQAAALHLNASSGTNTEVIAIGDGAANGYTAAVNNVIAVGNGAGSYNNASTGAFAPSDLVALGDGAGAEFGGSLAVGVGISSASHFAAGSHDIVGVGNSAATGSITGDTPEVFPVVHDVIGLGQGAAARISGNENIALGDWSLGQTNCGSGFTGTTGIDNVAMGDHALAANGSGAGNVAIGYFSGSNGWTDCNPGDAGNSNISGVHNTWVGYGTGPNTATQLSNTIALGFNAQVSASNQMVLGNSSITQTKLFGCPSGQAVEADGSGTCFTPGGGSGLTLTTTGTSGAATLVGSTLNIPVYSGGGSGALTRIAQTIVSGTTTTAITFSSIPGTFTNLRVVFVGQTSNGSADVLQLQFNGDAGSHYSYGAVYNAGGTTASAYNGGPATSINLGGIVPTTSTSYPGIIELTVPLYAGTTFNKVAVGIVSVGASTNSGAQTDGGSWASTAAITSLTLTLSSAGHFIAGTTATLYGEQ